MLDTATTFLLGTITGVILMGTTTLFILRHFNKDRS